MRARARRTGGAIDCPTGSGPTRSLGRKSAGSKVVSRLLGVVRSVSPGGALVTLEGRYLPLAPSALSSLRVVKVNFGRVDAPRGARFAAAAEDFCPFERFLRVRSFAGARVSLRS